jgi:hypothetical protein
LETVSMRADCVLFAERAAALIALASVEVTLPDATSPATDVTRRLRAACSAELVCDKTETAFDTVSTRVERALPVVEIRAETITTAADTASTRVDNALATVETKAETVSRRPPMEVTLVETPEIRLLMETLSALRACDSADKALCTDAITALTLVTAALVTAWATETTETALLIALSADVIWAELATTAERVLLKTTLFADNAVDTASILADNALPTVDTKAETTATAADTVFAWASATLAAFEAVFIRVDNAAAVVDSSWEVTLPPAPPAPSILTDKAASALALLAISALKAAETIEAAFDAVFIRTLKAASAADIS